MHNAAMHNAVPSGVTLRAVFDQELMYLIGLRNAIFSGFATRDYAEKSHFDRSDNGATLGLRCSRGVVGRPFSYSFVQPTVRCRGKIGVIVLQPFGTFMSWRGDRCEHTSSVDAEEFYQKAAESFRVASMGVVAAQQMKLLSVSSAKSLTGEMIYWRAYEH